MTSKLRITRRDFLNGAAMGVLAGSAWSPIELLAKTGSSVYPPALTGMRGNHPGSFEVGHAVTLLGKRFASPDEQTDEIYDLVIAGGGISGLSAALLYQQRAGKDKRILILDNHDDFGGHAKRNEFTVNGEKLISYGGSQSIDSPSSYSPVSAKVLKDVGISTDPFYDYFDRNFSQERNLGGGLYFSSELYGKDQLLESAFGFFGSGPDGDVGAIIDSYPISDDAKKALRNLMFAKTDYLAGKTREEKLKLLQKISYTDFIARYTGTPKEATDIFRDLPRGIWGVGWDACSALEGFRWGNPGMAHLGLEDTDKGWLENRQDEPYIFHFPDGNAGVARSLVRKLIPQAVPGSTMEDLVLSRVDYDLLDMPASKTRIRLNSTAVNLRNTSDGKAVDVTYVRGAKTYRVRAKHAVYAGYHSLLPHIFSELPKDQVEAINSVTKVPLVYISIALNNWKSFANLGISRVTVAQPELMHSFGLDFPVSMGGYKFTSDPGQATVIHGTYTPCRPDSGMSAMQQHKAGRRDIYEMSFDGFESKIVRQMSGALQGGGFDAEKDIAAITVNRWPHGYAYEYNDLWDDPTFNKNKGPHLTARKQVGRVSIANSDASGYAYVNGAIDAADLAVNGLLKS